MAVTAYATQADVTFVLGQYGLRVRGDDNQDGAIETGYITSGLEVGAVAMNQRLFRRYAVASISASSWAKWCNAYLAAEVFCRRRGMTIPASLKEECDGLRDLLDQIKEGHENLMSDTGLAAPKSDNSPAMSNLTVDGRFRRSKIRRVPSTSTGRDPDGNVKRNESMDNPTNWL